MAKHVSTLLFIAFALIATNADAAILGYLGGIPISYVDIRGILRCSLPGAVPAGPPLVGVNVTLSCDGGRTTLVQATTNSTGIFRITISSVGTISNALFQRNSNCSIYAKLRPALNCAAFPPNAVLRSPLSILGIFAGTIGGVFGFLLQLLAVTFRLV